MITGTIMRWLDLLQSFKRKTETSWEFTHEPYWYKEKSRLFDGHGCLYLLCISFYSFCFTISHSNCIYVVITTVLYLFTAHIIIWDLFLLHLKLIDYLMCSIKNSPCLVSSLQVGRLGARLHMLPQQVYVARVS